MATFSAGQWNRDDGGHELGYFWTTNDHAMSAFEDVQEDTPRFYAWLGGVEDHDREMARSMTAVYPTLAEAIAALPEPGPMLSELDRPLDQEQPT